MNTSHKHAKENISETEQSTNILVISHGNPSEFVMGMGALAAIRRVHKHAKITLLTEGQNVPYVEGCPHVDVIHTDPMPIILTPHVGGRLWKWYRAQGFDRVYDLSGSVRTNWYFRLIGFKKPAWNGPVSWCSHPYDIVRAKHLHVVERLQAQLKPAHIARTPEPSMRWLKAKKPADLPKIAAPYALIALDYELDAPHFHAYGFADMCDWLRENNITPVLFHQQKHNARLVEQILALCETDAPLVIGKPLALSEQYTLVNNAAVTIGHASGLVYSAALRGNDVLLLATEAQAVDKHAPRGKEVVAMVHTDFDTLDALSITPVLADMLASPFGNNKA